MVTLYIVTYVDGFVPYPVFVSSNKKTAIEWAKDYTSSWEDNTENGGGSIYFNQEEDGSMEYAIQVDALEWEE